MKNVSTSPPLVTLDDVVGREFLKKVIRSAVYDAVLNKDVEIAKTGTFMFVGPEGSGKTFLCHAMAGEFCKNGYKYICCNVDKSGALPEKLCDEILNALNAANVFLMLRNIERLEDLPELERLLTEAENRKCALAVVSAAKSTHKVDLDIGRMFTYICTDLPDYTARKLYFKKVLRGYPKAGRDKLAAETDGCGYNMLQSVAAAVKLDVKNRSSSESFNLDNIDAELNEAIDETLREYTFKKSYVQVQAVASEPESTAQTADKSVLTDVDIDYSQVKQGDFKEFKRLLDKEKNMKLDALKETLVNLNEKTRTDDFPPPDSD